MPRYESIADLQEKLRSHGIITKNIRRADLTTILDYIKMGNLEIVQQSEDPNLIKKVELLEDELTGKNHQLRRLSNSTKEFQNMAMENEDELNSLLAEKNQLIKSLRNEIANNSIPLTCNRCEEYEATIAELNSQLTKQEKELTEVTSQTMNLKLKIANLQCELDYYVNDSLQICNKSTQTDSEPTQNLLADPILNYSKSTQTDTDSEPSQNLLADPILNCSKSAKRTSRILLLGDSQARGSVSILKSLLSSYQIMSIFKPNAKIEAVLEDMSKLTSDFTKEDYVIILAGSNNALKGSKVDMNFIKNWKPVLEKTNIILLSVPYWHGRQILNKFIFDINCHLYDMIKGFPLAKFVDINKIVSETDYTRHGLHLNGRGKRKIYSYVANLILYNELLPYPVTSRKISPAVVRQRVTNENINYRRLGNLIYIHPRTSLDDTSKYHSSDTNANGYNVKAPKKGRNIPVRSLNFQPSTN